MVEPFPLQDYKFPLFRLENQKKYALTLYSLQSFFPSFFIHALNEYLTAKKEGGDGSDQFFQTSAVNFLAACIYFFCNYEKRPYNENGQERDYFSTEPI